LDPAVLMDDISVLSLFLIPFFLHLCHWSGLRDGSSTCFSHWEAGYLKKLEYEVFVEVVPTEMSERMGRREYLLEDLKSQSSLAVGNRDKKGT